MIGSRILGWRVHIALLISVIASMALAACAGESESSFDDKMARTSAASGPLIDQLRRTVNFDYEPAATPADLLDRSEVAVVATVQSAALVEIENEGERNAGVVVTLRAEEAWKLVQGDATRVDVVIRWAKNAGLDAFERGLPAGTKVAFFGYGSSLPVIDRDLAASPIYEADPQGLLIEAEDGSVVNVWADHNELSDSWQAVQTLQALYQALGAPQKL